MRTMVLALWVMAVVMAAQVSAAKTAHEYGENGTRLAGQQNYDTAAAELTRAIELAPRSPVFYINRGYAHYHLGRYLKALNDYNTALKYASGHPVALNGRGCVYGKLGEPDLALADFEQAMTASAEYAVPRYNRGSLKLLQGQIESAMADYDKGVDLAPRDAIAHLNRGTAYLISGDMEKARNAFSSALDLQPDFYPALSSRGLAHFRMGMPEKAVNDLEAALNLSPSSSQTLIRRAVVAFKHSDCNCAWEDLEHGLVISPLFNPDLALVEAPAKAAAPKKTRPSEPAYIPLEAFCDGGAAYLARGIEYYEKGQLHMALMDINNALRENPGYGKAFRYRGMIYQKMGDAAQAQKDLAKANQLGDKLTVDKNCCIEDRYLLVPAPCAAGAAPASFYQPVNKAGQ